MPNKPTKPFGHLRFSKDGTVRKEMFRLPDTKAEQERGAMMRFVQLHNSTWPPPSIEEVVQLSEADNDFSARVGRQPLVFELTEIVDRQFTVYMSSEELATYLAHRPKGHDLVLHPRGDQTGVTNVDARDAALAEAIRAKIDRSYSKPNVGEIWLVVFSVASLHLEAIRSGALHVSPMLARARSDLREHGCGVFSVIWFCDLQTRPVRVWPEPAQKMPVVLPNGF